MRKLLRSFLPLCSIHGVARIVCILAKCDPACSSQLIGPEGGSKLKLGQSESFPGTLEVELRKRIWAPELQDGKLTAFWWTHFAMWLVKTRKLVGNKIENGVDQQSISFRWYMHNVKQNFSQLFLAQHPVAPFTPISREWRTLEHDCVAWMEFPGVVIWDIPIFSWRWGCRWRPGPNNSSGVVMVVFSR